jgi:signal transduction histidine kinase/KaiC/GvpD/RAD55 family RecA-like ATPase
MNAAAERGECAAYFSFDENPATLLLRTRALGMRLAEHREAGRVVLHKIEPAELSPGEFIQMVRDHVEKRNASMVVIDSLNGYLQAMPDEKYLIIQLHELLSFLASRGVVTLMVSTQSGLIGNNMSSVVDASYLADNVVLLRFFEAEGRVHQAISILKKRGGRHERTIREFTLDNGVHVGEPLNYFRGVLTGVPRVPRRPQGAAQGREMTGASEAPAGALDRRLLLCAPTGRDARLVGHILAEADIAYRVCANARELAEEIAKGAGAVLVAEEALSGSDQLLLAACLSGQPRWSDLALILLTIRGGDTPTVGSALRALGNVTLLERPLRAWALLSVVRSALRARARQYELRDQFAELERVVGALREAETTLRDADRRKDEFLASLAHELRNPLAPIRNCVGLLKMAKQPDARMIEVARDVIDRQSQQLSRLVDDLLDLSRITRGTVSLQRTHVPLAEVVRNAVETSEPALRAARVSLVQVDPAPAGYMEVDPVRIAQAISNILNNAAKFTPEGGTVTLDARCEKGVAVIRIRDDGAGIDPEMITGIFDLFVQEHRPDGRWKAGLGIGLTLVRRFVELHGGTVSASSDGPGKGSEFVIRLPCVVEAGCDKPPTDGAGAALDVRPILVVDDNRDNAQTMSALLGTAGIRGADRLRRRGGALARPAARAGSRAHGYRHARDGRLRSGAPHPLASGRRRLRAHRDDRVEPGRLPRAGAHRRVRPPPGEARGLRPPHPPAREIPAIGQRPGSVTQSASTTLSGRCWTFTPLRTAQG